MKKILCFTCLVASLYASENKENISEVATEVKEIKKDSKMKDFWSGFKLKGFAFGRYHTIHGENGSGYSQQYRTKLDVTTGKVYGYSLTGGLFFSNGSSAIDKGRVTDGDVYGSRASAYIDNFADRFNIAQIYASKEINMDFFEARIDVGKMNLISPLNDKSLDIGLGGSAKFNHKIRRESGDMELGYSLQFFDSWISDHANYNIRRRAPNTGQNPDINGIYNTADLKDQAAASVGIGNNLSIVTLHGKNLVKGLNINLTLSNVFRVFDVLSLGDVSYKIKLGDHELGLLGQVAFGKLNNHPALSIGYKGSNINHNFGYELNNLSARYRGIYNIQAHYKWNGLSVKFGFLHSFADGYGVLLSNKSGIDTAGKFWNGNLTATYEGLGVFGSGSFKGTSIGMLYSAINYSFSFPLKLGLDVSYIFGKNNLPVLDVMNPKKPTHSFPTIVGGKTNFINADFVEIAPTISYSFIKNLEASVVCAVFVGDLSFIKTRTEIKWTF